MRKREETFLLVMLTLFFSCCQERTIPFVSSVSISDGKVGMHQQFPHATQIAPLPNLNQSAPVTRFALSSPFCPLYPCELDETGRVVENVSAKMSGGVSLKTVITPRLRVPISVASSTSFAGPVLLSSYASYGAIVPAKYDALAEALLRRGWTVATAYLSGNGIRNCQLVLFFVVVCLIFGF